MAIARVVAGQGRGPGRAGVLARCPVRGAARDTDTLVSRGMARAWAEDFAGRWLTFYPGDRLRAGVPLRYAGLCLGYLSGAEYCLGFSDDAVVHAELAVSLALDADRCLTLAWCTVSPLSFPRLAATGS